MECPNAAVKSLVLSGDIEKALSIASQQPSTLFSTTLKATCSSKHAILTSNFDLAEELICVHHTVQYVASPEIRARLELARVMHRLREGVSCIQSTLEYVKLKVVPSIERLESVNLRKEMTALLSTAVYSCLRHEPEAIPYSNFLERTWEHILPHLHLDRLF